MGHGLCDVFNKQMPLAGPGGRATSDDKIIGEHAWKLLTSFNFDPKELRGIGIQIQKLEPSSGVVTSDPGQARLPFLPMDSPMKAPQSPSRTKSIGELKIVVQPPSQEEDDIIDAALSTVDEPPHAESSRNSNTLSLPSFSQVDMEVFGALPDDVRKELEMEYERRSTTPDPAPAPALVPGRFSIPPPPRAKITVKGTNLKRITQQLAPRNRPSVSPKKSPLFAKRDGPSAVRVSDAELHRLEIDPDVFAVLPVDLQREQLAMARLAKTPGGASVVVGERKVIKPFNGRSRSPSVSHRRPPPKANYPQPPLLKQQGREKGEKLYFTETDDVQRVIESWVGRFAEFPPNQKDVDYFAKFLVQCVDSARSTDMGLEKGVAVVKWWLVLLRRHWAVWELAGDSQGPSAEGDEEDRVTSEIVGRAWWKAFREVKEKMDVVARKKFGGCLSLK